MSAAAAPRSAASAVALPRYVQIEPVGQCNLRCRMCPIQFRGDGTPEHPPAFMDFDAFRQLLDGFGDIDELHLQGMGEPLMHPRFFDMVALAAGRGIRVSTNTNLTLLSEQRARQCVASGLAAIHVSLDGASAATYEAIRVRGRFERVRRNLDRLLAARAAAGATRPEVRIVAVAMRRNLHELADIVRLAHAAGVAEVFVQHLCHDFDEASLPAQYLPMRAWVEDETLLGEDPGRVARCFTEARAAAAELGVGLRLPPLVPRVHPPGTPGRSRCDWPWRGAYVSFDAQAMPCCMVATPDRANLGDMARAGVDAVWNGEAYARFRAALESDAPPAVCRGCALYRGTV